MLYFYYVLDPPVKWKQPLSLSMLYFIRNKASSSRDKFISHLLTRAFFFAIRSYEYMLTLGELQSKIVLSNQIAFINIKKEQIISISPSDTKALSFQIIFVIQKNLEQDESISN